MGYPLQISYRGTDTPYVILTNGDGEVLSGSSWVEWDDEDITDYDVALTNVAGAIWAADMPSAVATGTRLTIQYCRRTGASPTVDDLRLRVQYDVVWTGVAISTEGEVGNYGVSLEEVKLYLRIDVATEDDLLDTLMATAHNNVEKFLGRTLLTTTQTMYLDAWPTKDRLYLPFPPVQSITSVVYTDVDGVENTMYAADYTLGLDARTKLHQIQLVYGASWPTGTLSPNNPIVITYVAGYGATHVSVPGVIRTGILSEICDMYEHRGSVVTGTIVADRKVMQRLLWNMRCWRIEE